MARTLLLAIGAIALAAGCHAPAATVLSELEPVVVAETPRAARMLLRLPPRRYVLQPEWASATVTLRRDEVLIASRTVAPGAGEDAYALFPTLAPGGGYRLSVAFHGPGPDGSPIQVASAESGPLTIRAGGNTVDVTVVGQGTRLTPVISQPVVAADGLAVAVGTHNHHPYARVAGVARGPGWVDGYDGGTRALDACLLSIAGIQSDAAGNLYVADYLGHAIRRLPAGGGPTTVVAGTGAAGVGIEGRPAASQPLSAPIGLARSDSGELFVCESTNRRLMYVATDGTLRRLAGAGTGGVPLSTTEAVHRLDADIGMPGAMVLDDNGDVYFTTIRNRNQPITLINNSRHVWRISAASGAVTHVASLEPYANEQAEQHARPLAIDRARDRLYVPTVDEATGKSFLRVITGIAGAPGTAVVSADADSLALEDYSYALALAFDQHQHLYSYQAQTSDKDPVAPGTQTDPPKDDIGVKIWRFSIDRATGRLTPGAFRVRIAGTGDTAPTTDPATLAVESGPSASLKRFSGHNMTALHVDTYRAGDAAAPAALYAGNGFFGTSAAQADAWSQLVRIGAPQAAP